MRETFRFNFISQATHIHNSFQAPPIHVAIIITTIIIITTNSTTCFLLHNM